MKRRTTIFGLVTIMAIGGLAAVNLAPAAWADSPPVTQSIEQTQVFTVENMTCAACPITVKKAMSRVDGVKDVTVDYDAKTATVIFDSSLANVADIASASTDVGYPAAPIGDH